MTHEHPDQPTVSSGTHSLPKGVHLVGSVPLSSAEKFFVLRVRYLAGDCAAYLTARLEYAAAGSAGNFSFSPAIPCLRW